MNIKNVKLGDYNLKDLLEEIRRLGIAADTFNGGYNRMMSRINELLLELKK